jgi:hypothetical protein
VIFTHLRPISALPPKADIETRSRDVRFVPKADILRSWLLAGRKHKLKSLRKAACRALAHAGCTAPEIMAVSGHSTLAQVQIYIEEVESERLASAAIGKLGAEKRTRSG